MRPLNTLMVIAVPSCTILLYSGVFLSSLILTIERHTWASWHIQNGTSLQELQMLGGWASLDMVLRYAHLSSDHLRSAAEKINSIKIVR